MVKNKSYDRMMLREHSKKRKQTANFKKVTYMNNKITLSSAREVFGCGGGGGGGASGHISTHAGSCGT